ncbi:DUF427 domain-containing protein [Halomonas denitrificans]|uniref:DUF427 domain-containing protein n=1 Tax=Halomonas TaxID=2745 RepID=UPI001A8C23D7|nr:MULTISPECIES: DUF427 domain-containing protein [Halomonas]MED5295363.1 DUF427 domain-containing protein [Pseudomonadota bacterium]MBN8412392.1 DUF427 domain-containing protein [Halomonas litopenaei]MBY5924668.1 DUF427 domain-containing protein [Halomonas sp. DP4Y7-2]MBY5929596.1 DUF427 domain-containing protein [Halomonas sp. DP8Y7-3]MBY5968629.1 DUF427 domain-containing protein [Halomonas denitrificans]
MDAPRQRIAIYPLTTRVRVDIDGEVVADTLHALELNEPGYPTRLYLPRADVDMTRLTPSETRTHCPFKGDASYFHVDVDGQRYEDAVWSYEHPLDDVQAIRAHLVFDPRIASANVES